MQHPFTKLQPEYSRLLAMMKVRPEKQALIDSTAKRLLGFMANYNPVTAAIEVPQVYIGPSFEREASSNFHLNPAQGWPLNSVSKWIPHNGPFATWYAAAIAAYKLNGLDKVGAQNWTWELLCFYGETFNGWGYRDYHHMQSPYLWACTNIQKPGKYTSDGHFDTEHFDTQIGIIPVARRMVEMMPSLALQAAMPVVAAPSIVPEPEHSGIAHPDDTPKGLGTKWVKWAINELGRPLVVNENYDKVTMQAVADYQRFRAIDVDGLAGPKTITALRQSLAAVDKPEVPA